MMNEMLLLLLREEHTRALKHFTVLNIPSRSFARVRSSSFARVHSLEFIRLSALSPLSRLDGGGPPVGGANLPSIHDRTCTLSFEPQVVRRGRDGGDRVGGVDVRALGTECVVRRYARSCGQESVRIRVCSLQPYRAVDQKQATLSISDAPISILRRIDSTHGAHQVPRSSRRHDGVALVS